MFHTIAFTVDCTLDLEISAKQPLERLCLKSGTCMRTQLKPYVVETEEGPVEVADLYLEDGSVSRGIPFDRFSFVD